MDKSMQKKRVTQIFPFLLPVRIKQQRICFYAGMRLDGRYYAKTVRSARLPHTLFETSCGLYNSGTGFDMVYQKNKVFNLKLAAMSLDGLLIKPGETFSYWQAVRYADKYAPYKDGLTVIDGRLVTAPGGGLCQMSNLLFWVFLHSPLTIVERHAHRVKTFPSLRSDEPEGVDAAISEGWLDLKVQNNTDITFQIGIDFNTDSILGCLYTDRDLHCEFEIEGKGLSYFNREGRVFEKTSIYRRQIDRDTRNIITEGLLYENLCEIAYPLPPGTKITAKGD